jgi:DNA repair protein RecN (Recombination protein N)
MLHELRVENLLLIERSELALAPGLNVLTGETGAGKTVLAHAIDLLLGGRARTGIVRPGAREAYVEGVFDIPQALRAELAPDLAERVADAADELVLARRVGADGRTRAYISGRSAPVSDLRDIGGALISFYGQHEHRRLTMAAAQLEILDGLCGPGQRGHRAACAAAHARIGELEAELEHLEQLAAARERELDLLDFELSEIDALEPDEREHAELLAARERLRRSDALQGAAAACAEALAGDASEHGRQSSAQALAAALPALEALDTVDPALDALTGRAHGLLIEARELAAELHAYAERSGAVDLDAFDGSERMPPTLEALEERLAALDRVARKHGGSIAAVLEFALTARARREELAGAEEAIERTRADLERARAQRDRHAKALRAARRDAAARFEKAVAAQLAELAMPDAAFAVALAEREPGPAGADTVDFVIAPNPGVPAGPVREIASGGELSRVMLAIMGVANESAGGATLVFDEVDAGIGGRTARAVGARLRALANRRQVVCITHLPQIASLADRHFSIAKDTTAEPARTTVSELHEAEVVGEIVRMLGADSEDAVAREHARELLRVA